MRPLARIAAVAVALISAGLIAERPSRGPPNSQPTSTRA